MSRTKSDTVLFEIFHAVTAKQDVSSQSLPPIQEWIDADALQSLVAHAERHSSNIHVEFEYSGSTVTVSEGGTVEVE